MTDYRRTEEEIWEEDVAEDERPTNVLPLFAVPGRASAESAEPAREPDATTSALRAVQARPAHSDEDLEARSPDEPTGKTDGLDAGSKPSDQGEPEELLEVERRPLPPPAPLPSMMLGPTMSTRGDITERVSTIPRTHPFANSLAPGGSVVTLPPRRADHTRWYGLGAAALLAIGAAGALLLQSRGEHHGAVRFDDERSRLPVLAAEETVIVMEESPAPVLLAEPEDREPQQARADLALAQARTIVPRVPEAKLRPAPSQPGPAKVGRAPASTAAPAPAETGGAVASSQRMVVGSVQLREASAGSDSSAPDRAAVMKAMDRIGADLRSCVGDEHGVADVTLTVRGNGAVTHALVEGAFAGSEKGTCIARTLRGARLPSFAQPVLHIAYPLKL